MQDNINDKKIELEWIKFTWRSRVPFTAVTSPKSRSDNEQLLPTLTQVKLGVDGSLYVMKFVLGVSNMSVKSTFKIGTAVLKTPVKWQVDFMSAYDFHKHGEWWEYIVLREILLATVGLSGFGISAVLSKHMVGTYLDV